MNNMVLTCGMQNKAKVRLDSYLTELESPLEVNYVATLSEAKNYLEQTPPGCVIIDTSLPDALGLLSEVADIPSLMLANPEEFDDISAASVLGAGEIVIKDPALHYIKRIPMNIERAQKNSGEIIDWKKRFNSFADTTYDILYELDEDGKFTYLNSAVAGLGYIPSELVGQHFSVIISAEDLSDVDSRFVLPKLEGKNTGESGAPKLFDERRKNRVTEGLTIRLLPKGYTVGESEIHTGLVKSFGDDSTKGYVTRGIIRDITIDKKIEMSLKKLYTAIEEVPVPMAITNQDRIIEYINLEYMIKSGLEPDEIIGNPLNSKSYYLTEFIEPFTGNAFYLAIETEHLNFLKFRKSD